MGINQLLKQQIELVKPDKETLDVINDNSDRFVKGLKEKLKNKKINAEVFIGGSLAKKTIVKKDRYDVDIFVRFDKKYKDEEISSILGKIIDKSSKKIHGSRDYYQQVLNGVVMEIIPVLKIKTQQEARNITDLSYFHVIYINKIINKKKKLADEIIIAKTFAHAQNCYGAESYIHGFSGYALELLICHYASFKNFLSAVANHNKDKLVIDDAKFYKDKNEILRELNKSKTQSQIILIDPTFKERNALAGLSNETFNKFKESCKIFLKNPDKTFFMQKNLREELSRKYGKDLRIIEIKTNKQAGDIAGSKSKKFFEFLVSKSEREFNVKLKEFEYDNNKNLAHIYFVLGRKEDEKIKGPPVTDVHNLTKFKKAHKNAFIEDHIAYAKIKHDLGFEVFIQGFKTKEKKIIKEMSIEKINLTS